jgi:MerR family copper efflux transcriptional regulator
VDGLTVAQLARRSGVPPTTVRFYDAEGLLRSRRSGAGYRLYDDAAVERLRFIGTAKRLGLPLTEVRRLLEPWEHGVCADVQHDLAPLVAQRLAETHERIVELRAFAARLGRARDQLATLDRDAPCGPSCTGLGREGAVSSELAVACTLDAAEQTERVDRWRAVLADVTAREPVDGGLRLRFDPARTAVGELATLAAGEAGCCPFLTISLHLGEAPTLEVRAPEDAVVLVHELFGEA